MNYLPYPTKCNTIASKFESVDCDKQIMNYLRFYIRRQYFFTNHAAKNELLIDELKIHVYHSRTPVQNDKILQWRAIRMPPMAISVWIFPLLLSERNKEEQQEEPGQNFYFSFFSFDAILSYFIR